MKWASECLPIKLNKNVIINIMIEPNGKIIEKLIIGRIECELTPLYMIIKPPWLIKQTLVTAFTNLSDMPEYACQEKRWVIKYESVKDPGNDFEFPENSSRNDKNVQKGWIQKSYHHICYV